MTTTDDERECCESVCAYIPFLPFFLSLFPRTVSVFGSIM